MQIDFKTLREQLTDEAIKTILAQYNVEPVFEDLDKIIFPTCCHNLIGGSPKLYYYKNSKLFHCYTECDSTFDIFDLLQKMMALRGKTITLTQAIALCDLDTSEFEGVEIDYSMQNQVRYLQEMTCSVEDAPADFKIYDKAVLRQFHFDQAGLTPWTDEHISIDILQQFNISYDSYRNAIVIPNFDYDGRLIGVRERFFNEEDVKRGKYRPLYDKGVCYSHPTGRTFYGIYENHINIERKHIAVIFEGEKSVLKYGTFYGKTENIALATLGRNITRDHVELLSKMGVRNVILAYDTDYEDYAQLAEVEKLYIEKGNILAPYFNVSILIDYDFLLPYKSSPIDKDREVFEKILAERRILG